MATDTSFKSHPLFARFWMRSTEAADRRGAAEHRRHLLDGLRGRVLELGAGDGRSFAHYPAEVEELIAVEPEPTLRAAAEQAAADAPISVRVVEGVADALPAESGSVDAAVVSLVLCSVPDQERALAELRRVLRPRGELRFYEHVQALDGPKAALLTFADRTFWPRVGAGCHPARHTGMAIEAAGFEIEWSRRFDFSPSPLIIKTPHILGRARRRI